MLKLIVIGVGIACCIFEGVKPLFVSPPRPNFFDIGIGVIAAGLFLPL